jgi:succinyl-CoA synthetase alpha subunit
MLTSGVEAVVTSPPGRRMGHAGALIAGGSGTGDAQTRALREAGAHVLEAPWQRSILLSDVVAVRCEPRRRVR